MKARAFKLVFTLVAAAAVGFSAPSKGVNLLSHHSPDIPPNMGRDALRQIVQDQCIVNWTQHNDPAPCERVYLADGKTNSSGYAVLADRKGGAHYLLIPTQTMAGTDASELLDPDLPNYFAQAWRARDLLSKFVGHEVPRPAIGLAINNVQNRSQDQFHIHIECLRPEVMESLHAAADHLTDTWSPVSVAGSTYEALRIQSVDLDGSNPFELLATLGPETRHHMGDYTVVVAGMQFTSGPGFVVLTGTGRTGELLLESSCTVAGGGG
jgi:CDP-diacylglycerol pyrophosphatase